MKQIILYGITGANEQYRATAYRCIYEENISIEDIKYEAEMMVIKNPSTKAVFAMDNRYGLKREYIESYKKNTIESCAVFKDTLEREGLRII